MTASSSAGLDRRDVTISEGNSGTKVATFTATRSGGTAVFDVDFATSTATATIDNNDMSAASEDPDFGRQSEHETIRSDEYGDTKDKGNET